ncbi:MAG: lysylphosphatidylglycerol synthase transmembrane domain-containing protein [Thermodesulfobacteriota bacterium]
MKQKLGNILKLGIGLAISAFFMYLAFRKVDLRKMGEVIKEINYFILTFAVLILFVSHWIRAVRHRYLLEPVKSINNSSLFSALMIGYMANTFMPAHLGEFLRAYLIGKKEGIAGSSTLATIMVERIIDVLSLLMIMGLVFTVYPFPDMVKFSAYMTFAFALGMVGFLVFLQRRPEQSLRFTGFIIKPFPERIRDKFLKLLESFRKGLVPLKNRQSYVVVFILSILIWMCYASVFVIGFYAFDFIEVYNIPLGAGFVVLVITTISILVPSSPGYVGTYHYLCMLSLSLFAIPESPALGYAIVIHAISMFPAALVGAAFALKEGVNISKIGRQKELDEAAIVD